MAKAQVIDIVAAEMHHAIELGQHLAPADIEELKVNWRNPADAVVDSLEASKTAWAAVTEDGVICMWGIVRAPSVLGGAMFWILTGDKLDKYTFPFIRGCKAVLKDLAGEYGYLENYVDSRHDRAIRLLEWMGFTVDPNGVVMGAQGIPFHRFSIRF